jgi:hypothetical protein
VHRFSFAGVGGVSPLEEIAAQVLAVIAERPDLTLVGTVAELCKRRIRTSRSSLLRISPKDFVQTKGFGLAL